MPTPIRCASHKNLCAHLDALKKKSANTAAPLTFQSSDVATAIRDAAKAGKGRKALRIYDVAVNNTGLEGLAYVSSVRTSWIYSNAGETYADTLILHPGRCIMIGNWGSIAERFANLETFTVG